MNDIVLFLGGIVLTYATLMLALWLSLRRRRRIQKDLDQAFVSLTERAISNGGVSSRRDMETLYQAHFETSLLSLPDYERLVLLLRKVVLKFATPSLLSKSGQKALDSARLILGEVENRLEELSVEAPFSETPAPERQILEDVQSLVSDDEGLITRKLHALARAIRDRESSARLAGDQAENSLKYAKRGLWVTVVLWVLSGALAVWLARPAAETDVSGISQNVLLSLHSIVSPAGLESV